MKEEREEDGDDDGFQVHLLNLKSRVEHGNTFEKLNALHASHSRGTRRWASLFCFYSIFSSFYISLFVYHLIWDVSSMIPSLQSQNAVSLFMS